jgi:benzodiazapine receptor
MQRKVSDWAGNIAGLIIVIAVNAMANAVPIGGQTTGQVSAKLESLFTPAGFTFGIWGVIYTGLIIFVIYQALPGQRANAAIARIGPMFKLNCLANALWIFAWHYDQLIISFILMLIILGSLVRIYLDLGIASGPASTGRRFFVHLPFSLYTGWISVATIANFSAVQSGMGLNGAVLDPVSWTLVKLALAGAIGAAVILRRDDIAYGAVVAWAGFGILSKQSETPAVAGSAATVVILALVLMVYVAAAQLLARRAN